MKLPDVDHFRHRVLQDAFAEAMSHHWRHRAEQLEDARPRPGDYPGQATPQQRAARDAELAATAHACRVHAALFSWQTHLAAELDAVLEETWTAVAAQVDEAFGEAE